MLFVIFIGDADPENRGTLMTKLRDPVNREKKAEKKKLHVDGELRTG